jgi:pSer/pThr/pTyr-binding forkhead associated (FHA) protein
MSKLVLYLPDGTTLDVPLTRERTTIGRRADNDVCLPNLAVSGEHAVVVTILADSFLEDLNSTNGTLVNGNPIAKHFLRDRDQIDIGRHRLMYCVDDDAAIDADVAAGMARVYVRDFGERVEPAKPFVRAGGARPPDSPPAREDRPAHRDAVGDLTSGQVAEPHRPPDAARAASTSKAPPDVRPMPPAPVLRTPHPPASDAVPSGLSPSATAAPMPSGAGSPAPSAAFPPARRGASIKLLSGAKAGALIALTKTETTVGRPGVQVASIIQTGTSFRLKPVEGASPPKINGKPIDGEGAELSHGDTIEIAGSRLEFVDLGSRGAKQNVAA